MLIAISVPHDARIITGVGLPAPSRNRLLEEVGTTFRHAPTSINE
jgi:hypothetical protein